MAGPAVFGLTHVGRTRAMNQDQFLVTELHKSLRVHQSSLIENGEPRQLFGESVGQLFLVADGMGGHLAGERASALAMNTVANYLLNHMAWPSLDEQLSKHIILQRLAIAFRHCQTAVWQETTNMPHRRGMGTTLTMAMVAWPQLYLVHVGDSRCYTWRVGQLKQLTRDHTVAQRLVDDGQLQAEHLFESELRNVLWNVIGGDADVLAPQVLVQDLEPGDQLLLCSDGLTRHVTDDELAQMLSVSATPESVCRQMIDTANSRGGLDNVTVIVARYPVNLSGDATTTALQHARGSTDDTVAQPAQPFLRDEADR